MRYQLVRTSPYLGGQIRWDIPLDSHYENGKHILRTKGLHIVPLNDDIPFREDNSWDCLKYDHAKNISNLYNQIGDAMFSSDGEYSTIHWLHQGNDLLDPYSHKYIMGSRRIRYQRYGKQFAFLCPLWISEQTDPSRFYFVISVRVVGEERDHIARTIIRLGDDISNYMKKYLDKSAKYVNRDPSQYTAEQEPYQGVTDDLFNIKFDPDYAYITGISVANGLPAIKNVSYMIPDMVNKEQPLMEFDNMLLSLFSSQKMIAQQLINLNFVFNIEDISYYLKKELLGKHITISIRVGYQEEPGEIVYDKSTLIPLRDFYTDYRRIPVFRADMRDFSMDNSVFEYMGDNSMLNYVHANKFTQPVFHWTMVENPEYIYNFYDGFAPVFMDNSPEVQKLCRTSGHYYDQADISAPDHTTYNNAAYWCKYMDLSGIRGSYLWPKLKEDTHNYADLSMFSELIINKETNIAYLNNNRYDLNKMDRDVYDAFMALQGVQGKHPTLYLANAISDDPEAEWGATQDRIDAYNDYLQSARIDHVYEQWNDTMGPERQRYNRESRREEAELPIYTPDNNGDWVRMLTDEYTLNNEWEHPDYPGAQGTYRAFEYHLGEIKIPVKSVDDSEYTTHQIENPDEAGSQPVVSETLYGYTLQEVTTDMNDHQIDNLLQLAQGVQETAQGFVNRMYVAQGVLEGKILQYQQAYEQVIVDENTAKNAIQGYYINDTHPDPIITFKRQMVQAVSGEEGGNWSPANYDEQPGAVQAIEWIDSYCQKVPDSQNYVQGSLIGSQYVVIGNTIDDQDFAQGFTSEPGIEYENPYWYLADTQDEPITTQPVFIQNPGDGMWDQTMVYDGQTGWYYINTYSKYDSEPTPTQIDQTNFYSVTATGYDERIYIGLPSIEPYGDSWRVGGIFLYSHDTPPNIKYQPIKYYIIDNDLDPPAPYQEGDPAETIYFNEEPRIDRQYEMQWNIEISEANMLRLLKYSELYAFNGYIMDVEIPGMEDPNIDDYRYQAIVDYVQEYARLIDYNIYSHIIVPINTYFETEATTPVLGNLIAWMMSDTYTPTDSTIYNPPNTYPGPVSYGEEVFKSDSSMEICSGNIESAEQMLVDANSLVEEYTNQADEFDRQTRDIRAIMEAWDNDAYDLCGVMRTTGDTINIGMANYIDGHYYTEGDEVIPIFEDGKVILMFINSNISNATFYQMSNFIIEKGSAGIVWIGNAPGENMSPTQKDIIMNFIINLYKCWVEPYRISFDKSVAITGVDDMIDGEKPKEVKGWYIPQSDTQIYRYTGKLMPLFIDPESEKFVNYTYRYKQWQDVNDPKVQKYNKQIRSGLNPIYPSIDYYCFEERKDSLEIPAWYYGYGGANDEQEGDHEPWEWEIFWKNDSKIIELPDVYQDHTEPMIPVNYDEDIEEKYMWGLLYKYIAGIMEGHSNWVISGENGPELNLWLKHKMKELYSIHYDFEYATDEIQEGDSNLKVIYYVNFRLR